MKAIENRPQISAKMYRSFTFVALSLILASPASACGMGGIALNPGALEGLMLVLMLGALAALIAFVGVVLALVGAAGTAWGVVHATGDAIQQSVHSERLPEAALPEEDALMSPGWQGKSALKGKKNPDAGSQEQRAVILAAQAPRGSKEGAFLKTAAIFSVVGLGAIYANGPFLAIATKASWFAAAPAIVAFDIVYRQFRGQ